MSGESEREAREREETVYGIVYYQFVLFVCFLLLSPSSSSSFCLIITLCPHPLCYWRNERKREHEHEHEREYEREYGSMIGISLLPYPFPLVALDYMPSHTPLFVYLLLHVWSSVQYFDIIIKSKDTMTLACAL